MPDTKNKGAPSVTHAKAPRTWLRHFFEKAPALLCVTDPHGILLEINEAGVRMLGGTTRQDFVGILSLASFFSDTGDADRFQQAINGSGSVQEFETSFRRMDGRTIDVSITGTSRLQRGACRGYEAFIVDITERKRKERSLAEIAETYHAVVENSLAAISIHQEGRNQFVNRRYAEMLGFDDPSQCIGRPFWSSVHPEDLAMVRERGLLREKQQILPAQYIFRQLKKDRKTVVWVQIRATHAMYMGKQAAVTNFIDITSSKMAEEEIRNLSARLVKVREDERKKLAADLHDQMGQTLTAMHFEIEALQKDLPASFTAQKKLCDRLVGNVEWLANQVRRTTSYLRKDLLDQKMLIAVLERHILEFTQHHPDIAVTFQPLGFKKRLNPEIELILFRIFQEGLTNIVKHAQATRVEIMLTYSHPRVMLTIRDNGIGFNATDIRNEKELFTKGIGLISMKERVISFGGHIDILSAQGKGTTIRVDIPV